MAEGRHSFIAFYPSDWLAGTARMARMHRSVYFDICCYIWDMNEPCPRTELPLMLGDIPDWERYVDDLVASKKLIKNRDGSLSNAKAHAEARKAFDLWQRKSIGGKAGAEKTNNPKDKDTAPVESPAGTPDGSSPKTAGSPVAELELEPDYKEEKESTAAALKKPAKAYKFEGDVIRLTPKDYDNWATIYSAIPDIRAELTSLDAWLSVEPDRQKKWFQTVSGALNKKHQTIRQERMDRPRPYDGPAIC